MRKTLFIPALAPVLLLAFVWTFSARPALACCVDNDGDGYGIAFLNECPHPDIMDCDDSRAEVNPGATEAPPGEAVCTDGLDNDCDDSVDAADTGCQECVPDTIQACNTGLEGECAAGTQTCGQDGFWGGCVQNVQPSAEVCDDGLDNDCDGSADAEDTECWECEPNDTQPCDTGLLGVCAAGTETCGQEGFWGECVQDVEPSDEICNDGLDNNCNGWTDTGDKACVTGGCSGVTAADASVYGAPSEDGSGLSAFLLRLLLPIGLVAVLRKAFRKR